MTMKRQRGRGRRPVLGNRSFESNGPDVKIRGTAAQIHEKYTQYARDAQTSGDRVKAENYLQHAEHYYRLGAVMAQRERQTQLSEQSNGSDASQPDLNEEKPKSGEMAQKPPQPVAASGHKREAYGRASNIESGSGDARSSPDKKRLGATDRNRHRPRQETRSALDALAEKQASSADD